MLIFVRNNERQRRALGERELEQFHQEHQRSSNPHVQVTEAYLALFELTPNKETEGETKFVATRLCWLHTSSE